MTALKSLTLIASGTLTLAAIGCGGDTTVVEHPAPAPAPQPASAVAVPPPGSETEVETEHPDGSETKTTIKNEVDD
jgi:hypothetical protein